MHIVAHQQPSLVRFLPPPEMEGPVMIDPRGPGHEDFIHERRMRVNGDLDRHFEVRALAHMRFAFAHMCHPSFGSIS